MFGYILKPVRERDLYIAIKSALATTRRTANPHTDAEPMFLTLRLSKRRYISFLP